MNEVGIFLELLFIFDIVLSFRTSYQEANGEYERDFNRIARNYLKTWFIFDFIATFPVNTILAFAIGFQANLQLYNSLRLIKFIRIVRLRHIFQALNGLRVPPILYLFVLLAFFVLFAHWNGCIFWAIGVAEGINGTWITFQNSLPNVENMGITEQYATSIYWSFTTITTLGYGDIHPRTAPEQLYNSVIIIIGASFYSLIIGLISYVLRILFDNELQRENHNQAVRIFGLQYHLTPSLQRRIRQYYDFVWERKRSFNDNAIVDDLPLELRADIADAIHNRLFQLNPLLKHCMSTIGFRKVFATRLKPSTIRIPEEILYFEKDSITEIFFIRKGVIELISNIDKPDEFTLARRSDGQHCGEVGLFDEEVTVSESLDNQNVKEPGKQIEYKYAATAVVKEFSEVNSILAKDLLQLLEQFPREKALFKAVAITRLKHYKNLLEIHRARMSRKEVNAQSQAIKPDAKFRSTASIPETIEMKFQSEFLNPDNDTELVQNAIDEALRSNIQGVAKLKLNEKLEVSGFLRTPQFLSRRSPIPLQSDRSSPYFRDRSISKEAMDDRNDIFKFSRGLNHYPGRVSPISIRINPIYSSNSPFSPVESEEEIKTIRSKNYALESQLESLLAKVRKLNSELGKKKPFLSKTDTNEE